MIAPCLHKNRLLFYF